jgi:hypothetical protein
MVPISTAALVIIVLAFLLDGSCAPRRPDPPIEWPENFWTFVLWGGGGACLGGLLGGVIGAVVLGTVGLVIGAVVVGLRAIGPAVERWLDAWGEWGEWSAAVILTAILAILLFLVDYLIN